MGHQTGLLIGRFQPFHLGHLHAVEYALQTVDMLLLGIGSSNLSREQDNPFTAAERRSMIQESLDEKMQQRVSVWEIPDMHNHMRWMSLIRTMLPDFEAVFTNDTLTAHLYRREGVSVYAIPFKERSSLSGTAVRRLISGGRSWEGLVPAGTDGVLRRVASKAYHN